MRERRACKERGDGSTERVNDGQENKGRGDDTRPVGTAVKSKRRENEGGKERGGVEVVKRTTGAIRRLWDGLKDMNAFSILGEGEVEESETETEGDSEGEGEEVGECRGRREREVDAANDGEGRKRGEEGRKGRRVEGRWAGRLRGETKEGRRKESSDGRTGRRKSRNLEERGREGEREWEGGGGERTCDVEREHERNEGGREGGSNEGGQEDKKGRNKGKGGGKERGRGGEKVDTDDSAMKGGRRMSDERRDGTGSRDGGSMGGEEGNEKSMGVQYTERRRKGEGVRPSVESGTEMFVRAWGDSLARRGVDEFEESEGFRVVGLDEAEEEIPVGVLLRRPTIETRVPGAREEALLVEAELRRRGWAVWREVDDDGTPMKSGVGLTFTNAAWEWVKHGEARGIGEPGNAESTAPLDEGWMSEEETRGEGLGTGEIGSAEGAIAQDEGRGAEEDPGRIMREILREARDKEETRAVRVERAEVEMGTERDTEIRRDMRLNPRRVVRCEEDGGRREGGR